MRRNLDIVHLASTDGELIMSRIVCFSFYGIEVGAKDYHSNMLANEFWLNGRDNVTDN